MRKNWQCLECGRRMTTAEAEKMTIDGCKKCGGYDVDLISTTITPETQAIGNRLQLIILRAD